MPTPKTAAKTAAKPAAALRGRDKRAARTAAPAPELAAKIAAPPEPESGDLVRLRHDQIAPHPLNPRKDFDSDAAVDDLSALRESILTRGLRQNLVVRAEPDANGVRYIVSGERRWRAIGAAIADDDLPADYAIPCLLQAVTDAEHALDALAENMLRRDLSPLEEARAFKALTDGGARTAEIADQVGRSQKHVQDRLKLLALPPEDQARMGLPREHPDHLSYTDARDRLQEHREKPAAPPAAVLSADPPEELPPAAVLVLVEVADCAARKPFESKVGPVPGATGTSYVSNRGPTSTIWPLVQAGLLVVGTDFPYMAAVTRTGLAWLAANNLDPATRPGALTAARTAAGMDLDAVNDLVQADAYATKWLNLPKPPPPPEPLTAAEQLVLAEILDACKGHMNIRHDYDRKVAKVLADRNLIQVSPGSEYGSAKASLGIYASAAQKAGLDRESPEWKAKLRAIRIAAAGEAEADRAEAQGRYLTPWLNGPIEDDPKIAKLKAARQAEHDKRQAEIARKNAEEAESEAKARAVEQLAVDGYAAEAGEALRGLLHERHPLPWAWRSKDGVVRDAVGAEVELFDWNAGSVEQLVVLAVNMATGSPHVPADAPAPKLTREQFEQFIAKRLMWHEPDLTVAQAAKLAGDALDASLAQEGCAFGDDNYGWDVASAEDIADGYAEQTELLPPGAAADAESEAA